MADAVVARLQAVEGSMAHVVGRFDRWCDDRVAALLRQTAAHRDALSQRQFAEDDVKQKERALHEQCEQLDQRLAEEQQRVVGQEDRLADARGVLSRAEEQLRAAQAAVVAEAERAQAAERELATVHASETTDEATSSALAKYEAALGLKVARVENADASAMDLRFSFSHLDERAPEREAVFCLRLGESGKYELIECDPLVPDADALMRDLNATNDFFSFVPTIRAQFRRLLGV